MKIGKHSKNATSASSYYALKLAIMESLMFEFLEKFESKYDDKKRHH